MYLYQRVLQIWYYFSFSHFDCRTNNDGRSKYLSRPIAIFNFKYIKSTNYAIVIIICIWTISTPIGTVMIALP